MSEQAERKVLRAELSDAVWKGAIPDLGNPNTAFAQQQIAEWVIGSAWLAQHDAALLASRDARLGAVEALAEKIRREYADAKAAAGVTRKPFSGESATEARVLARIERRLRAALHSDPSESA